MSSRGVNLVWKSQNLFLVSLMAMFSLFSPAFASAQTTVSNSTYNLGNVAINSTGATHTVSLKNTGASSVTISSVTAGGPYGLPTAATSPCGASLAAGASCNIGINLSPTALGAQPAGTLTITSSSPSSPNTVALSGNGVVQSLASPSSEAFGNVAVGATSAAKTVTFYNDLLTSITVSPISVASPYSISATTCGTTLNASSNCTISLTVTPTALGNVAATSVSIASSAANSPVTVALTAAGVAPTTVSPTTVAFGNVVQGQPSLAKTVTLYNNEATALTISSITPSTGVVVNGGAPTACGSSLAAGANCTISLTWTPAAVGALTGGSLTISTNASNSPLVVPLTGAGTVQASASPTAINFGNVVVGATSALKTVTLTNYLPTTLTVSSLTVTAASPYVIDPSSTCLTPTVAANGGTCTVNLTVTPSATGAQPAGTLTITDSASNSPQTVTLSATGIASVVFSPTAINFGNGVVGVASAAKTILVTNNSTSALTFSSNVFNGPFVLDTTATTCPVAGGVLSGSLAAGAHCNIGLDFKPTVTGATSGGQITVIDSAPSSPQVITLSGVGVIAATVSPTPLGFGNQVAGTTSAVKNVTLTNHEGASINLTTIGTSLPYAIVAPTSGTACVTGGSLASGASCTFGVTFAPTVTGAAAANSVTVTDTASNTPQIVTLTGSGVVAVTLPSALAFGNVVLHQMAEKNATLVNNQSTSLTIASISGFTGGYSLDATQTTCSTSTPLLAGKSCVIGVDLTATTLGTQPAASFTVAFGGGVSSATVSLTASALPPVFLSPSSVSFPTTFVGVQSGLKTVLLTNEQNVPLTITSGNIIGADPSDFSVGGTCPTAPQTLPATKSCTIDLYFTPGASGARTATLSIVDNAFGSPQTLALSGNGNAPVVVSPDTTQTFTSNVGTTSAFKTFTIYNEQTTIPLHIYNFKLTGPFIQTATTCPISPAALGGTGAIASCTLAVEFDPTIGGVTDGQLQVQDDAATTPQVVNLTGTGTNPLTVSPTALSFSAQTVGTVSASKLVTLTNHESQSETFTAVAAGSLAAADYQSSTNCATGVIAAQSSCLIYVNFSPTSVTPSTTRGGSLSVADSAPGGLTLVVSLTGSATSTPPAPAVSSVSPGAGASGTVVPVVITGNGWTHFTNASVIKFVEQTNTAVACNIAVSGVTATNANTLNATLTLSGGVYGGCNISVQTPKSGGGTETASLISAFNLADPTLQHTITAVSPAFGIQGQTLNVAITAVGTHFIQGTTIANFGDGVSMNSLTITSPTTATANITISNTTYIGYRTVTMQTVGEFAISQLTAQNNPIFQIGKNNSSLVSVTPNVEPQSFSGQITINAAGTHFLQSATTVAIGGVIVGSVNVINPTQAVAEVAIPATAPIGVQNVQVATGGEIENLINAFTITGSTPALVSVVPSSGVQGQNNLDVIITGNAFTTFNVGALSSEFTGEITVNSTTALTAHTVDANISIHGDAVVGPIVATLVNGTTNFPFTFSVTPSSASIVSVSPSCIPQGGQLTLNILGSNTSWVQGTTTATFYPESVPTPGVDEVTITDATHAQLAVAVPTTTPPGNYGFYMATGGQVVSASMCVTANTPTLTMSPANGLLPTAPAVNSFTVNFTGQFTNWGATTLPVIAGEGVTLSNFQILSPVSASATLTIIASVNGTPTATGQRLVTFTTGGQIVTTIFNVTQTPVGLIYITPDHTAPSTTVNVAITGLNTHFTAGTTQVLFGPQITVNSVTVTDATHLTANISTSYLLSSVLTPSPSGWQTIFVNTGAEQVLGGFLVDYPALPSLVSVSPSSGAQGATLSGVVITGNLTTWQQGVTQAILGAGVSISNLVINSPTQATATIAISPTAPVGGNTVVMYTGSQIVSGSGFSVIPSASYIQSVEPNFVCPSSFTNNIAGFNCSPGSAPTGVPVVAQLQTVTLNIVGVGTHWLQGETTMNFGYGVVTDLLTVSSPTTAQAQITVLSVAAVGFSTLTATTDGEVVYLQQAIDIEDGSPILLAFSPSGGEQGTSTTLQLLGRFTHFNQATTNVAFNQDIAVNSINVIDDENMTANITISPLAYVDFSNPCGHVVTITTGNEQVFSDPPTLNNFCVAQGAEEITLVNPAQGTQGSTETLTITGSATDFVNGETQVSFGDGGISFGTVVVTSPTTLTVPVAVSTSASVGFHTATVTTLGEVATQQFAFTVSPGVATLNEAIPNQAEQGAPIVTSPTCSTLPSCVVRLIGQYSHFNANSTATMGAGITINSVANVSATEEDASISIDPLAYTGGRLVTVSSPGVPCSDQPPVTTVGVTYQGCAPGQTTGTGTEIVTAYVFTVIPGPAIIEAVKPNTGNEGQEVVFNISGSATHWAQNFTQFYIAGGGSDLTINSVFINSATSATVDMNISPTANPGARSIYMVTNGESLTDSGAFVVTGGVPVITYLSPNSQQNPAGGTTGLEVAIHGLYTNWTQGVTTVNFGPGIVVDSYQVDDATDIEAVIDIAPGAQPGYRTVVVQTGSQGLTGNFNVTVPAAPPKPYIWYESPGSALPGQTLTVTIYGAYTDWQPGTGPACGQNGTTLTGVINPSITINCFQVLSPTSAIANITIAPNATASTSDLTLTTGGEVENTTFSVVIAQPVLTIVDPGSGLQGSTNLLVDILGQYTTFDNTTTFSFGGVNSGVTTVGPPTILGPTIATQVINIAQLAPLGGVGVTATTPDAAPIAQSVTGAGFSVTPSLALIASISPNTSPQGTTITVDVQGQFTHWNGSTYFQFGDGIVVTSTTVNSATDATLTLAIPAYAGEGPTGASAHTGGEDANITNGFVVTAGTPYLLSSGPGSVPQQSSAVFTILSQATTWSSATPPVVSYGPWITLTNVNVTGPTSLTVEGYVNPLAPVGYYNLTVSTGTQVLGINNAVSISPGPAVVNSVTPNNAGQGVNLPAVQINGINTHWAQGTSQLTFPNVLINSYVVNSPTSITANITVNTTAPAGEESVTVTTGGEIAYGPNVFTVTQDQPELLAVVPNGGMQGLTSSPVTLTADFTNFVNGTTTANFGTGITVNSVTVTSATQATANITVSPTTTLGYRNVSVTTGTQVVSLVNAYQVIQGPAEIVGALNPATGGQGHTYNVQVTGSQTHWAQGVTTAQFGGGIEVTGVTVTGLLNATVTIFIPTSTATGAYNVSLTTGGEVATILGGFTVGTGSPQISAVSPPTGSQGLTNLSINLTGLFTHWVQGTSIATFGSGITVNSLTVNSSNSAVANITISQTATIGSYNPTITTGGEVATLTGGFSVTAGVPALTTVAPGTIQAGATGNIVINGTFTNFQLAFTNVSFGSGITVNFITVTSFTQLTANITAASNAAVGGRTIQVNTLSTDLQISGAFNVTSGTPVITQINPNIGTDGQTLNVTLTGLYTNWIEGTTTVSFGSGITVNTVTVNTTSSLDANITIGASAALGPYDVITTTGGEVENVPAGFTVQAAVIPPPSLLSISPGVNAGGIPINSAFTIVFSQPMNRTTINTSTVEFWLISNPSGWVTVPGTVSVDATGRVATFTPTSLLAVNSQYYMLLTNGIQDATGNTFPQYGYASFYTVDSANTTPSTVVAANPPANATNVGTNVTVELQFSADMNQETQTGLVVSTGGNPVPGTWSWNAPVNCCSWGPGTLAYFTPTTALAANTVYTVTYGAPLADTAGNGITPGSFNFTTGAGADTTQNNSFTNFNSGETNIGTNFAPKVGYNKPINPIDINQGTLLMYNADSGKYVQGTVTVAPNGLSATFTPQFPLLPDTYYYVHQSCGDYDMDGIYLNCNNWYFTTGAATDTTPPTVVSVSPANTATSVPLNAQVTVHFSQPIQELTQSSAYTITVTPQGGSAIAGTANLSTDLVTLTFVPSSVLTPGKLYTVQVSNYFDMAGNAGATFSSTFTTAASSTVINVSTGLNASGQLIAANNTNDAHWVYFPEASTPSESTFGSPALGATTPLQTVGPADTGWWTNWAANGPTSDWITINPNSVTGNTFGLYYTTFNISGSVPANLCLVGSMGVDDNGLLAINGTAIMSNLNIYGGSGYYGGYTSLYPLNIPVSSYLTTGQNVLALGWGTTDNSLEAFRLGATIQTCGASFTGGLSLTSSTPANNATGVAVNSTITLNFNNALDPATVNANTLPLLITWNGGNQVGASYQVTGNQVIITPDSPLPVNEQMWVGAVNGPYDTAGDSLSNGGSYTQIMSFTTGTTAIAPSNPFQVTAFAPANNATNVGLRAPVTATFNRSVNPYSINPNPAGADFGLFAGDSQAPWCNSYSKSQDNTTLSFNCYALPSSTVLTAVLNSGLSDWTGDALTPFTSQFTTALYDSNTNASVITTRPGNGAGGIGVNQPITIYTNLPINPSTATNGIEVAQNNVAVPGSVAVLDSGYTLEFTPSSPWTPGALIQWWTVGSVLDSTYNTPLNGDSGYFYVAAGTATLVPAVQVASPPQYSNPVALNSIFDVQFNTPLNPATVTSSNVYLYDQSTTLNIPVTLSQPQPNEIRMVPTGTLPVNHYLYVELTTGLQSTTSVPLASNTSWYEYTGTAVDSTLPTIVSAVPYSGATNVGVNDAPGVVISKPIDPVSVNPTTFTVSNGGTPLAGTFYLNSTDTRVQFVPNAPLPAGTPLTMALNGVLDQVGHPITFSSSFQTGPGPDFTAPTVLWSSANSSESIPINSAITVQFSESMDVTTFAAGQPGACGNFYIYDYVEGTCIPTTLTWNSSQTIAYLVPTTPLSAGRQYELVVYGGTDLAGNQVSGFEPTFYAEFTSASSAPTVIAVNPSSGFTGLGTNAIIEAEFSGPIDPTSIGNVTLTSGGSTISTTPVLGSGDSVLQLIPAAPLLPGTTYKMNIVGVKDPAGNTVATVTNTFTTGATFDVTQATAINSDPAGGTTSGTNVTPKLVFNKPLNPLTVNNSTFRMFLVDTGQFIPLTVTESTSGLEVTMTPLIPLLPSTEYHFQACCGYQDQDGNPGIEVDVDFYTGGGAVSSGPTVTVSPANGTTGVPLNAQVYVTVSAPIDPTTWTQSSVQLLQGSTQIAGTGAFVNAQTLTFTPTSALTAGTVYTVKILGSAFTDADGNAVVPSTTSFTTGTVAATGGLTITSTNIVNGSTVTSYTQPIIISFSQTLIPSTVNSATLKVMDGWNSYEALAGTYAVSGNQVTFTPANPYPGNGSEIFVGNCGGPTDILGDVFLNGSCYNSQFMYFYTPAGTSDSTPLTVLSVSPANGATNVRPDVPVSVTFNKSISQASATINSGHNAMLFAGQGLQDGGSITMSADNRTMTFNFGTLYTGTLYTIQLPAGGITDMSGNSLAATFNSTFTTGTNPATGNGSVQSIEPAANSTGVPTDSLLTFFLNRQVNASTLPGNVIVTVNGAVYAGTVTAVADNYEVQFTPTTPFPNSATVQWWFSALGTVLDVNGDIFNGDSGTFYTAAAPPNPTTAVPTLIAVGPSYGSSTVPTNAEVDLEYSQPIDQTTVAGNVNFAGNPPVTITFPAPNIIRVVPTTPFNVSSNYYVCTTGNMKGTNGVSVPYSCYATNFDTSGAGPDTTHGTVTIGPPNGSPSVGTNAYIRFWLSKPMDITTINSTNITITAGGNAVPGTWGYNYTNNDVREINFSPVNPLPPSTAITVKVNPASATSDVLDYAGNTFTAASSTFTTAALPDYTQPTVTLDFPYGTGGIGTNASFTCLYSEPMDPSSATPGNTEVYSYVTNAPVPVTYSWASDLMSVTMTPITPLFANSQYEYQCYYAIDLTGNGQSNAYSLFYTGNGPVAVGPSLVYANPPSGMTNVPLNSIGGPWNNTSLMLLFNEPLSTESMANITFTPQGGSAEPIAVYAEDGNTIADVQLPWALAPNTTYTFNFAGVTDLNGNPAQGTTTSSFTTGTGYIWNQPTEVSVTPADQSPSVAVNVAPTITFSTLMNPALIDTNHVYLQTAGTHTVIPTTLAVSVVAGETLVKLTPIVPLVESTIYQVVIGTPYWDLYDVAGNSFTFNGYTTYNNGYVFSTFTTGTAAAVNGACGSSNGGSFSAAPTANLCSAGTASAVTNPGSWTWTCNGQYTGTNASCSATVTGTLACSPQLSSLQGLWPGTDNTTDYSPNGYNGTLEDGVTYALGVVGDAFNLEGNASNLDEFISIGSTVPTNLQIQNAITLSAWIYPTQLPTNYGSGALGLIIGSQHDGTTSGATIFFDGNTNSQGITGIPPGHIQFQIGNGSWHEYDTTTQLPLNQWTLITATRTANNPAQIYYNGVLQPSVTGESAWNGTVTYSGSWFALGQQSDLNRPFVGLINDAQVYSAALTQAQVTAIFNAGSGGVCQ